MQKLLLIHEGIPADPLNSMLYKQENEVEQEKEALVHYHKMAYAEMTFL